ncbi:MAG TPA: pyridoxal-phosphate dependent enzyme, partial [Pyrinomonadaceae bacterium]|nr:pyridoxal-phosphate dependent enzyme [Pyrinomonadaceae bacterium]
MFLTHLECTNCGKEFDADKRQGLCGECSKPLFARYDHSKIAKVVGKNEFRGREASLWRYREVLPVRADEDIVSLGEGWTPLLKADRLAGKLGLKIDLYIKDEGVNPTQSFKSRGMTAAVSMAKQLGVGKLAVPSAGNAAGAMAA